MSNTIVERDDGGSEPYAALDLVIDNMTSDEHEKGVMAALEKLVGIISMKVVQRGVRIRYDAEKITKDEICGVLRMAGFLPATFQDTKTGETGTSTNAEQMVPE